MSRSPSARRIVTCALALALAGCATQAPPPIAQEQAAVAPPAPPPTLPVFKPPGTTPLPDPYPQMPLEQARAMFVRDTAAKYGVDAAHIEAVLARAQMREPIIKAMSRPAEAKPWRDYRPLLVTDARINGGRAFLEKHREKLARVEAKYGVPAEVIVAIIGIETSFGANTGKYPVVDALYTLGFAYPRTGDPAKADREARREAFFRNELGMLFALGKAEGFDVGTLTGSYAGAMGWGQFMPSSYLEFAVDGDGDGKRDLFNNLDDVFASIANYFVQKGGWERGGPVVAPALVAADAKPFAPEGFEPAYTLADLAALGYRPATPMPPQQAATVVYLDGATGREPWITFRNFYAITRYNISKHYAMAVHTLAEAIAGRQMPPAAQVLAPAGLPGA
ncbi:lytic murein transglycosylase B [Lysobacter korlensis]|uniref:Lytic murein transglycosylase B n=1 Tax=Lysobacter korlensis TaxID=553636 RepID=A0ABV6RI46_9GAMM